MKRSEERILTTHTGSLPRSDQLVALMVRESEGKTDDAVALAAAVETSTRRVLRGQLDAGIDVGNDGEQGRESFFTYVQHRLGGWGGKSDRTPLRDLAHYPTMQGKIDFGEVVVDLTNAPRAVAEIHHVNRAPLERECAEFDRLADAESARFSERFMNAASPGIIGAAMTNDFYPTLEDYVFALADALRPEYQYIVEQGMVLQIDAPDLAMERHRMFADQSLADFQQFVEIVIAAINKALDGIPRDRVRLHACWGNYPGPHTFDVAMSDILPILYKANVGALVLPFANPRHQHEWKLFRELALPDDMLLVGGVIDTTANYVEHPDLVADRIEQFADAVGDPTRVLAGTDCGFDTAAGRQNVAEESVWEKLRSLRDGAATASRRLFG